MKSEIDIGNFLYAMRTNENAIGVICRESDLCTFSGHSISFGVDALDPRLEYMGEEEIIHERMKDFIVNFVFPRCWKKLGGFILPAGVGWRKALQECMIEHLHCHSFLKDPDDWENIEFTPNAGYPGCEWQFVVMSYGYFT